MAKYKTRQRDALLKYLSEHHDESLSVAQIAAAPECASISVSAIYRNLSALESEGKVRRVTVSHSREACYQFADADECRGELHLACTKCGRTFHMALPDAALLENSLASNEHFAIDKTNTVLYGTCKDCMV